MNRFGSCFLFSFAIWAGGILPAFAEKTLSQPTTYEIMIDGEHFLVEANRTAKLESKNKPGVIYQVALRLAPTQRMLMKNLQFTYDLPSKVELDEKGENRWVEITFEIGATMIFQDLGGPMSEEGCKEELDLLVKSVVQTYEEMKHTVTVGDPHQQEFEHTSARGVTLHYQDAQDIKHVCLVYVLKSPRFTAACIIEYLDNDREEVLPVIKKTLDSVEGLAKQG